jgi:tetratricopeptide (TPR) repeat protein
VTDDGDVALAQLDGATALAAYEAAEGVRAQAGRVRALWLLRRWDEARRQLSKIRQIQSVHVALAEGVVALGQPDLPAWLSARAGSALRDDEAAIDAFREAMRLDPRCAEAVAGYATALRMSGRLRKAQQVLGEADGPLRASTPVLVELALCAMELGDHETARDHLDRALDKDPDCLRAKLARLEVSGWLAREAPVEQARELMLAHRGASVALAAYGQILRRRANLDTGADRDAGLHEALAVLREAVSAGRSPTLVTTLVLCHLDLGERERAGQLLDEAIQVEPDSPTLRWAQATRRGGSPSQRLDAFQHVLDADPRDLRARVGVALALVDLNRRDEARDMLTVMRAELPGNSAVTAAWTALETPWQMPPDHELKTRIDTPWKTGEDDPDHVLDILTHEVIDNLQLTTRVAERLRHRVMLDRAAVLRRAFGAEQEYLHAVRGGRSSRGNLRALLHVDNSSFVMIAVLMVGGMLGLLTWLLFGQTTLPFGWQVAIPVTVLAISVVNLRRAWIRAGGGLRDVTYVLLVTPTVVGASVWLAHHEGEANIGIMFGVLISSCLFSPLIASWDLRLQDTGLRMQPAFDRWLETLYGKGLLPVAAEAASTGTNYGIWLPAHCRIVSDAAVAIDTDASRELVRLLGQRGRGSFALAGPRGAGKSTLVERWCAGEFLRETERTQTARHDLALKVDAPVGYDSRDFLVHLFGRLCDEVEAFDAQAESPWRGRARLFGRRRTESITGHLARRARKERERLRYLRTWTTEHEGSLSVPVGGYRGKISLLREDVPLSHPELVDRFRGFLQEVASVVGKLGGKVLIGIDELDRIHDGAGAQRFLNELKAVFNVPNCYFLVSVSEDALADFELSAMGTRTVFDSAFDTIVRVDYLRFDEAKVLLSRRIIDLPEQFGALAYVLSGGLARELARTVEVIGVHRTAEKRELGSVTAHMVQRQLSRTARAAMDRLSRSSERQAGAMLIPVLDEHPRDNLSGDELRLFATRVSEAGHRADEPELVATVRLDVAVLAEYLAMLLDVFDNRLDEERMRTGRDFETLARVRRYLGANPYGARELLRAFQDAWATGPGGR